MNEITMKLNMDKYILGALQEDITSEDITTNSVMRECCLGEVELICNTLTEAGVTFTDPRK